MLPIVEPQCPQCHSALPLWPVRRAAQTRKLFGERLGIACPRCRAKLAIDQTPVLVLGLTSVLFAAPLARLLGGPRLLSVAIVALIPLFLFWFAPYFWRLRLIREEKGVVFPLDTGQPLVDSEPNWVCIGCGEPNPETFEVCWNCKQPRPQAAAASNNRWSGP